MIPSLIAGELREAVTEFLTTTFALSDDDAREELARFLADPHDGIFRGPFLRVRTGFATAPDGWQQHLDWTPAGFHPYVHQAQAFARLTSLGHEPEPTIVTTGTGSGKTEAFLIPILDHCIRARQQHQPGIKALLLYPMNALATDQARRIAGLLHDDPQLDGITAGLYIGGDGPHTTCGPDHLIDHRATLRANPPDILLTNYKMLDFLLLRSEDRDLWAAEPGASPLRYVVLDEFHTYDGAQGTDVAMLLRRLGATTGAAEPGHPLGAITPVATSATLATATSSTDTLRAFAGRVFGTDFDDDSVIGETVESIEQAAGTIDYTLPIPSIDEVLAVGDDDLDRLAACFTGTAWNGDPVELGTALTPHPLTSAILHAAKDRSRPWTDVLDRFVRYAPDWGRVAQSDPDRAGNALASYLGLLSVARRAPNVPGGQPRPLFNIQVQLWIREISRLLRKVGAEPAFRWSDSAAAEPEPDPEVDAEVVAPVAPELPSVYCRHCGRAGWMATVTEVDGSLVFDANAYKLSLNNPARTRTLIRANPTEPDVVHLEAHLEDFVDTATDTSIPVLVTPDEDAARDSTCPSCGLSQGIRFLGSRVASLASVCITQLFGSSHVELEERKLLAFTDSVQDASHRAAFFAARTYRFNLRTELAAISAQEFGIRPGTPGGMTLADIGTRLIERADNDPAELYVLTPPDLLRHPEVRTLWTEGPKAEGKSILARRLAFEAAEEFGFRHHVGRTLELTGTAVASARPDDIEAITELVEQAHGEVTGITTSPGTVPGYATYVRGLLERLRIRGAIFHPWLEPYIAEDGNVWRIWGGRPDGMRAFPRGQSRPVFVTTASGGTERRAGFDVLGSSSRTPTWLANWAVRCLGVDVADAAHLNRQTFGLLAAEGIIGTRTTHSHNTVYGLDPAQIVVTSIDEDQDGHAALRCPVCLGRHAVDPDRADEWLGAPCLRYRCTGAYEHAPDETTNYYRQLYRSGMLRRVVSHEHTGLLSREKREGIESEFKNATSPVAPNVLACTPTMELGIDIGDLSAVMLTSMPRTPASYAQRIGRAGRSTGNAFIAAVLPTEPRSLYYLAEPDEMIAGEIRPPSCYLDAVEILERQYLAFLIDRTATGHIAAPPMPRTIGQTVKSGLGEGGWLRAVVEASKLSGTHVDDFIDLFGDDLAPETIARLRDYAEAGIETDVKEALETWTAEQHENQQRRNRIAKAIKNLESESHLDDDGQRELQSLKGERAAIVRVIQDRRNEYSLSALERLGLLPNYELHDDSVDLDARLWSRNETTDEYEVERVELQRSAQLALVEFAPANSFYTLGHRIIIDALDIGTSTETAYEWWRLCPTCGFGAPEANQPSWPNCPRCHFTDIADAQARHLMLRLRRVTASESEERSRVYDDTDERERRYYDTATTVDVDPIDVDHAWQHTSVTFGMELANRATIRTINFGRADHPGEPVAVAGQTIAAARFVTCRSCGAVAGVERPGKNVDHDHIEHRGWCTTRTAKTRAAAPIDRPVLFHDVQTEAVRFILPVATFEVSERLATFKAALRLGLRLDFGGEPAHLNILTTDHPGGGTDARRRILVLHDTVPGGTGYLGGLADPERLGRILEGARDAIATCPCRQEGRTACFRCLLGEVAPGEVELVSRSLALDMLDELLETWEFTSVATVAEIDIGGLTESELELRFKAALKQWADQTDGVTAVVKPKPGGHESIELRMATDGSTIRWLMQEQVDLATIPPTRPDFVFKRQDIEAPEVAVYTDGFQYHATPPNLRLDDDADKRRAVRATGRSVWSITWDDVLAFQDAISSPVPKDPPRRPLLPKPAMKVTQSVLAQGNHGTLNAGLIDANPMSQLLSYLRTPSETDWERLGCATVAGLAHAAKTPLTTSLEHAAELIDHAIKNTPLPQPETPKGTADSDLLAWEWPTPNGLRLTALLDARGTIGGANAERWTVITALDDRHPSIDDAHHQARWQDWLGWSNLLQFLRTDREALITTVTAASMIDPHDLAIVLPAGDEGADTDGGGDGDEDHGRQASPEAIQALDDVIDDDVRDLLDAVLRLGAPVPEIGYEFEGAPIEVAWPDRRIAILIGNEASPTTDRLEADGWRARTPEQWAPEQLIEALEEAD